METPKTELYFIVNPMAGSGKTMKFWEPAKARLEALGLTFKSIHTSYKSHASELAAAAAAMGYRRIFAVGGDGTLHEVLCGICRWCESNGVDTSVFSIGVVPVGSGNDWIKSLDVPNDTTQVADMIARDRYAVMDIVKVSGCDGASSFMANVGGTGFDSHVCEVVNSQKACGKRSRLIYASALVRTIANLRSIRVRVLADGSQAFEGEIYSIAMGNGRYSGSGMRQVPLARIDDGMLDYMIVPKVSIPVILKEAPKLFSGTIHKSSAIISGRCQRLEILPLDTDSADVFEVDGEVITRLPVTIEVTGRHVNALGSTAEEPSKEGL